MLERRHGTIADVDVAGENGNRGGFVGEGDVLVGVFGGDGDVEFGAEGVGGEVKIGEFEGGNGEGRAMGAVD